MSFEQKFWGGSAILDRRVDPAPKFYLVHGWLKGAMKELNNCVYRIFLAVIYPEI